MKRTALRIGSLLLILVLLLGILPTAALADGPDTPPAPETKTLQIYASYDGTTDDAPFYSVNVPIGTNIIDYLEENAPALGKSGYTFDIWYKYDSPDHKFGDTDTVTDWTKVLVKYTSVKTVTFVSANGLAPVVVELTGNTVDRPADPAGLYLFYPGRCHAGYGLRTHKSSGAICRAG